jgi:hypothetical protein
MFEITPVALTGTTTGTAATSSTVVIVLQARSLEEILIGPISYSFPEGSHIKFSAIGIYNNQTQEDLTGTVTWSVNDSAAASVDINGNITLIKAGTIIVSAAFEGTNASKEINITAAILNSIEITPRQLDMTEGLQQSFQAKGHYSDGRIHDITTQVLWQSNDLSIIDFNQESAFAKSAGSTSITATFGGWTALASITVYEALLQKLEISEVVSNLEIGFQSPLAVLGYFSDGRIRDVTEQVSWSLDNESILSIGSDNITVSGLAAGAAVLLANFSGFSDQQTITVNDATLSRIEISPKIATIMVGYRKDFVATGIFSNQTTRDITGLVTWRSSDTNIVEIENWKSSSGNSRGVNQGAGIISATYLGLTSDIQVEVNNAVLTSIEVSPTNLSLAQGLTQQFTATAFFADGSQNQVTDQVDWLSDNANLTLVAGNTPGLFKANIAGDALVIASLNNAQGFTNINITDATLTSLSILTENNRQAVGNFQTLSAFGQYSDGNNVDLSDQVVWESSNVDNADISNSANNSGRLTGVNPGVVTITAVINGQSSSVSIEITDAVLQSIELSSLLNSLSINQQQLVQATGIYSDLSRQELSEQIFWSSSDPAILSVSNLSNKKGQASALSAGSAAITASLSGVISPSFSIEVVDNPNLPATISISTTPNVILNDGIDSTTIQATVKPLQSHGLIADGTNINFVILENSVTRVVSATTIEGKASLNLTSTTTNGFIIVTAEINDTEINAITAIFSTDNFVKILQIIAGMKATLNADETEIMKGSLFALFIRNVSNRDFNLLLFQMKNGSEALPELPITSVSLLSDGILEGGEYTGLGYSLDYDTVNNSISAGYILSDDATLTQFGFSLTYQF